MFHQKNQILQQFPNIEKAINMTSKLFISCLLMATILIICSAHAEDTSIVEKDPKFGDALKALLPSEQSPTEPVLKSPQFTTLIELRQIPKHSRNRQEPFASDHISHLRDCLRQCWCSAPRPSDKDLPPQAFVKLADLKIDFAPVTSGFAILTFEGDVTSDDTNSIIPIVGFMDDKYQPVKGLFAGRMIEGKLFIAAELPVDASIARIVFVKQDYSEVPTEWTYPDDETSRMGIASINRLELAKQHISKANEEAKNLAKVQSQKKIASMELRTWRSKDGKREIEGELKSYERKILTILTKDFENESFNFSDLDSQSRKQLYLLLKAQRESTKKPK